MLQSGGGWMDGLCPTWLCSPSLSLHLAPLHSQHGQGAVLLHCPLPGLLAPPPWGRLGLSKHASPCAKEPGGVQASGSHLAGIPACRLLPGGEGHGTQHPVLQPALLGSHHTCAHPRPCQEPEPRGRCPGLTAGQGVWCPGRAALTRLLCPRHWGLVLDGARDLGAVLILA